MEVFEIDLSKPETERWKEIASKRVNAIKELSDSMNKDLFLYNIVGSIFKKIIHGLYVFMKWPYYKEMVGMAIYSGVSIENIVLINVGYEIDQMRSVANNISKIVNLFACSTVALKEKEKVYIGRNYDSKYDCFKHRSCKFKIKRKDGKIIETIGYPGIVGITTGILIGEYGIVLNSAPKVGIPNPSYMSPVIMTRQILEKCNNFEEAKYVVDEQLLCTSGIFMLFNTYNFSVVERTKDKSVTFNKKNYIARCNHFKSKSLNKYNINQIKSIDRNQLADELLEETKNPMSSNLAEIMNHLSIDPYTSYKAIINTDKINVIE